MRFIKKHQRSNVVFDLFLLNLTFLSFPFITSLTTSIVNFKKEVNTVKSEHGHHQMTKYPSQLTRIIKQYRISRLQATSGTMTTQPENSNLNYFFEDRDHHNVKEEKVGQSTKEGEVSTKKKLCRRCKQYYDEEKNTLTSCRYHSGRWMGAEESKHHGTRSGGEKSGLALFWDCCDGEDTYAVGCCTGKHISYDD